MVTNEDIISQMKFPIEFDEKTRGQYLFQAIWIDTLLNQIISYYFSPTDQKKQGMLVGLVLNDISFNSKIKYFLKILESYPEMMKKFPKIETKLENIRDFRNKIAHSKLDTSEEFLSKKRNHIRLSYYKNGLLKHYEISESIRKEKISEIVNMHFDLNTILHHISNGKFGNLIPIGRLDTKKST